MPDRKGDWIQTFTGKQFWPLDPRPEEIDIRDIAHSLSNQCRFSGHCNYFYSVAEHSVRVSRLLPQKYKLWGLLHDASEAYLVDLPRPIKLHSILGDEYRVIEANLMDCLCIKFGITSVEPLEIKEADNIMLMTEQRDLMGKPPAPWSDTAKPDKDIICPWLPGAAERVFLEEYHRLTGAPYAKARA